MKSVRAFLLLAAFSLSACTAYDPYAQQRNQIQSMYATGKITAAQYAELSTRLGIATANAQQERGRQIAQAIASGADSMNANLARQQAAQQAYAANQATIAAANAQAAAQTNAALINGIGRTAQGMNDNLYGRDYEVRRQDGSQTTVNVRPLNAPTW